MKYFYLILFLIISNLSHSYENNQLFFHNQPKKVGEVKLKKFNDKEKNIFFNKKKLYLLNFWATWCAPCLKEIPELIELKKKYRDEVDVIFISVDANPKKVIPKFLKKNKFEDILIYSDQSLEFSEKLGVKVMPTTILINDNLEEISRVKGYVDWTNQRLISEIESLL